MAVLARLWSALQELDIHPSGWTAREPQVATTLRELTTGRMELSAAGSTDWEETAGGLDVMGVASRGTSASVADSHVLEGLEPESVVEALDVDQEQQEPCVVQPEVADPVLAAYQEFDGKSFLSWMPSVVSWSMAWSASLVPKGPCSVIGCTARMCVLPAGRESAN
jgi:hypothetical protein